MHFLKQSVTKQVLKAIVELRTQVSIAYLRGEARKIMSSAAARAIV